jgi:Family of unknown function (DUF5343)
MTDTTTPGSVPPYISFGTLLNVIERMEREGVPSRIDPSYLANMAGGTRSQFKVCLRSLGLIDEDSRTTETLVRLAKNPGERPELLAGILRGQFPDLAALNGNATRGELEEIMAAYGLSNADTRRKAMTFYVQAATYAGFTLSPHLRPARTAASRPSGQPQARSRPSRKRTAPPPRAAAAPASPSDEAADMRRAYFDLLISKAKESTTDDSGLLDRIERLVRITDADTDKD